MKEYFIIVNNPNGKGVHALSDEKDKYHMDLELFETFEDAKLRIKNNQFLSEFGTEIFRIGEGR